MPLLANIPDFTKELTIVINEDDAEQRASFTVPQDLVVKHSNFFNAACRNEWTEATTRIVKLPDVDPDTFHTYLYWVHKEELPIELPDIMVQDRDQISLMFSDLAKLWLLCDRLADTLLRNKVMDVLLELLADTSPFEGQCRTYMITPDISSLIWSSTTEERPLRRLIVDYYAEFVEPDDIIPTIADLDPGFKQDLLMRLLRSKNDGVAGLHSSENYCHYHEHDEQNPACHLKPSGAQ